VTTIERAKYHHAWILADAVCNASGLGYDQEKKTWDLTTNVRPFHFECGLSFKETLDHWNIGTGKWLRHVVYERVHPNVRTVLTYMVSAMWHGFYPGYYITFLTGALITSSARTIRRHIRPYFLGSPSMKRFYDISTWTASRIAIGYCTFTFMLLDFAPSILIMKKLYFFGHILCLSAMFVVPLIFPVRSGAGDRRAENRSKTTLSEPVTANGGSISTDVKRKENGDVANGMGTNKGNGFGPDVPTSSTKLKTG
jgi:lysophospholipid acyltransferase 1/2